MRVVLLLSEQSVPNARNVPDNFSKNYIYTRIFRLQFPQRSVSDSTVSPIGTSGYGCCAASGIVISALDDGICHPRRSATGPAERSVRADPRFREARGIRTRRRPTLPSAGKSHRHVDPGFPARGVGQPWRCRDRATSLCSPAPAAASAGSCSAVGSMHVRGETRSGGTMRASLRYIAGVFGSTHRRF